MTNECSVAWAAGIFDGEGCVSIGCVGPSQRRDIVNLSYRLTVKVTMGCEETVCCFGTVVEQGTFQNHVSVARIGCERMNPSYSWVAMSRKAEAVLKLLRPYLITKSREADVALEFMALPDGRRGRRAVDPKLMAERHRLYLECCRLKPRWRFRKNKPVELGVVLSDSSMRSE